jgi:ABC-type dipeptide/oligopeptide/nickel transport system permease component
VKDTSSGRGVEHALFALILLGLGVLVGVINPLWPIVVLLSLPISILAALYWQSKIAYLHAGFYIVGYGICRFYLGYMAWHQ